MDTGAQVRLLEELQNIGVQLERIADSMDEVITADLLEKIKQLES